MRSLHLKQVGDIWYDQRRCLKELIDVEGRSFIRFSLKTRDFSKACALAAQYSLDLENKWIHK